MLGKSPPSLPPKGGFFLPKIEKIQKIEMTVKCSGQEKITLKTEAIQKELSKM
jgi:hypothetical protein